VVVDSHGMGFGGSGFIVAQCCRWAERIDDENRFYEWLLAGAVL